MSKVNQQGQNVNKQYNAAGDIIFNSNGREKAIQITSLPSNIKVNHKNSITAFIAEVAFTLNTEHIIRREIHGGIWTSTFVLWVDGVEIHRRELKTLQTEGWEHKFTIEDSECTAKYSWLSGVWYGGIYVGDQQLL